MTQILADANLTARLNALRGPAQVVDADGRMLGFFQPGEIAPPGVAAALSPNSHDRLRELRKQREGGLPLSEVLKNIGAE